MEKHPDSSNVQFEISDFCSGGHCVEVGQNPATGNIHVAGGELNAEGHRVYTPDEWGPFLSGVLHGGMTYKVPVEAPEPPEEESERFFPIF